MKLGKKFLIIVGIILLVFAIYIARNVWIIKGLQKRVSQYKNMENYYVKIETNDQQHLVMETYKKDGQYLAKLKVFDPDGSQRTCISCYNGERINTYIETVEGKFAFLNRSDGLPSPSMIVDFFDHISVVDLMKTALFSWITSEEYNGKDCYKMYYKNSPYMIYSENNTDWNIYFEKETGLLLKSSITEYEYEFNAVTDEDLVPSNLEEYEVKE